MTVEFVVQSVTTNMDGSIAVRLIPTQKEEDRIFLNAQIDLLAKGDPRAASLTVGKIVKVTIDEQGG